MRSRLTDIILFTILATCFTVWMTGCGPETEIVGTDTPNIAPQTEITGFPPTIYETSYTVSFAWSGFDHDGRIDGFLWRLSDNGDDGISYRDTLTYDPITGEVLNPWHFTTATDTTFVVSADLPNYPNDGPNYQRYYQTHTLFVRAVDNDGAADESPATISFTSTNLLPSIRVRIPENLIGQNDAKGVPTNVTLGWSGQDYDSVAGHPHEIRYLWKEAITPDGEYLNDRITYNAYVDDFVDFADSSWSAWQPYGETLAEQQVTFPGQPTDQDKRYLFAIQARDIAGAISLGREYGYSVVNTKVVPNKAPRLEVYEPNLGAWSAYFTNITYQYDIAAGQLLDFSWSGSADSYAGTIVSYRWGWDVIDPDDDTDPNWAVPPGTGPMQIRANQRTFNRNSHSLTVQIVDDSGQKTRFKIILSIVPIPPMEMQRPVLLVDDVDDHNSLRWNSRFGISQDTDEKRDRFWESVLASVVGFSPVQDSFDTSISPLTFRELVNYRVVIWTSKYVQAPYNLVAREFRPTNYCQNNILNWLTTYQQVAGNLFLAGSRSLNQFLRSSNILMTPIFFDTWEEYYSHEGDDYRIGFGTCNNQAGEQYLVGLTLYPYDIIGISMLDIVSPTYRLYGRFLMGAHERKPPCVGAKGLVIDPTFRASHIHGSDAFADTIPTNDVIDWADETTSGGSPYYDNLTNPWDFGDTEIYESDIVGRPVYVYPQMCVDQLCIEPMFRVFSRLDWIKLQHARLGDHGWPSNRYNNDQLESLCGGMAMVNNSSRTNGKPCGFLTHKNKHFKPSQKGDVVWGFDPYRFDSVEIGKAVHWVLGEHFGLVID